MKVRGQELQNLSNLIFLGGSSHLYFKGSCNRHLAISADKPVRCDFLAGIAAEEQLSLSAVSIVDSLDVH